jgi:hypothetical protein
MLNPTVARWARVPGSNQTEGLSLAVDTHSPSGLLFALGQHANGQPLCPVLRDKQTRSGHGRDSPLLTQSGSHNHAQFPNFVDCNSNQNLIIIASRVRAERRLG